MKHITTGMIKNGAVVFAASVAAVQGFKMGYRGFEKIVPEVVDKIVLGRAMASTLASDDDDYDDDEEDD